MGFNRELFLEQPVDKDFICGICLDVLQSPTTACAEGHTYCRSCLTQTLAESAFPKCPECRDKVMTSLPPCRPLQNLILRQNVRCSIPSNKKAESAKKRRCTRNGGSKAVDDVGCSWTGKVSDLEEHHKTCGYADVTCTLGCERVLPRFELQEHETTECGHRTVSCPCCDKKLQSKDLPDHLLKDCPKAIVACEFCKDQMPREDLGSGAPMLYRNSSVPEVITCTASLRSAPSVTGHYKTCCKTPFRCEFFKYGCKSVVKQEDLAAHYQSHAEQHALLLRKKLKDVEERIEEQKRDRDWSSEITIYWDISLDKLRADGPLTLKSSAVAVEGIDMYLRLDTKDEVGDTNNKDKSVKLSICAKNPTRSRLKIDSVSVNVDLPGLFDGGHDHSDAISLKGENGSDPCYSFSLIHQFWDEEFDAMVIDGEEVTLSDFLTEGSEDEEVSLYCSLRVKKLIDFRVNCET